MTDVPTPDHHRDGEGVTDRPGPAVVHDRNGIVSLTETAQTLLGTAEAPVIGQRLSDFVTPDGREALDRTLDRILDGELQALGVEVTIESRDGTSHDMIAVSSPLTWDDRQCVQVTLIDISIEDPRSLQSVRERAMHEAPVGITIADARADDMPLIYVNDGFVELTGYRREDTIGQNCRFLQGDATKAASVTRMREAIAAEESAVVELRNYRNDGTMFWNRVTISPVINREGEVTHYFGFQEDVSETKVFEHETSLFRTQIAAAEQAMFITDRTGTIEYINPAFERLTQYSAAEVIGQEPAILRSGDQSDAFYDELWETVTAGKVWDGTLWQQTKSGSYYQAEQKIVPVTDDRGQITHFVTIQNEITHDEIRDQVLQVLDRILRHNLRHAVTTISGYATALESELDETAQQSAVAQISAAAAELESISEQTRPIFEVFQGVYDADPWSVDSIVDTIVASRTVHPDATISVDCQAEPTQFVTSGKIVSIALVEAIENGVVHNGRDTPTVEVVIRPIQDPPRLHITIADDGPGLPHEEWEVIQSGMETPLSHATGIGLWLIYWTTTAVGGKVTMSEAGPRGTVVSLEMPLEAHTGAHSHRSA